MAIPTSTLGRTGEKVTKLGFGAMELRSRRLDPIAVDRLLNTVLDEGINLIDTSPDYGASEEHIGRAISHRRDEYFLATKCGCPVGEPVGEGGPAGREHVFTRENIRAAVEQSLERMRTDRVDLVQFHVSPSPETLAEDDSVAELLALRDEGKVRFVGISGTLPTCRAKSPWASSTPSRSRTRRSSVSTRSRSPKPPGPVAERSSGAGWHAAWRSLRPSYPEEQYRRMM